MNSKVALCSSHLCRQHAGPGLKEQCIAAELAEASCEGRACLPFVSPCLSTLCLLLQHNRCDYAAEVRSAGSCLCSVQPRVTGHA